MGLFRLLREWREESDGTLTGPAISTDDGTFNKSITAPDGTVYTGALGLWKEDGNSPDSETGIGSFTYTPATVYDLYLVVVEWSAGGSNTTLSLQVNGDAGANYDLIKFSGGTTSGASDAGTVDFGSSGSTGNRTVLLIDGRWGDSGWASFTRQMHAGASSTKKADNENVTAPLSQFTILFKGVSDADLNKIEVLGRDI